MGDFRLTSLGVEVVHAPSNDPKPARLTSLGIEVVHTKSDAVSIETTFLENGRVSGVYSDTLEASGGTEPYEWSVTAGALPGGLTLNASTGEISGTPTEDGTFNFTVQVEDDAAETDTQALSIQVLEANQYYTDFSEYDTGSLPAEWVDRWEDSASYTIEADAGAIGGQWFRQNGTNPDSSPRWVEWTAVPDAENQRVEAVIRNSDGPISTRNHGGVILRGGGPEGDETGYLIHLRFFTAPSRRSLRITRLSGGAETVLDTEPIDGSGDDSVWSTGTDYELIAEARGNVVRAKIWEKGTTEPEDWTVEAVDGTPLAAGGVGFAGGRGTNNSNNYVDEFLYITDPDSEALQPDAPTVTQADSPQTTLTAETSAFSTSDPEPAHTATRWQVRDASDPDWTTPIEDITTGDFLTSIAIGGMPENTDLEVRAAHAQGDVWSDWSAAVAFTSGTDTPLPETPVITDPVDEVGEDFVTATRTAFDHSEGVGDGEPDEDGKVDPYELAAQWQIRESGASWDDAVLDTGLDIIYVDVLTSTFEELDDDTAYQIRFRTQDGKYGGVSEWSNVVSFTTDAIPPVRPDTPILTVDSCGRLETNVSSNAFSHPEGGATHQASRWWIGIGDTAETARYSSIITDDVDELTEFLWRQLDAGDNYLAVSHQDDSDRWSLRSDAVTCTVRELPPVPILTSHAAGTSISGDTTFVWDMPGDDTWEFTGELSTDNGEVWDELFSAQEESEYAFSIAGKPNDLYLLRIKACYPSAPMDCSYWLTIPFRIDRFGRVSADYRFADYSSIPADWVPMWDPAGHVSWTLVDKKLNPIGEAGAGECVGLHARHTRNLEQRESVLAFTELGQPDTLDITVSFGIMLNTFVWHGWRFSQSRYTAAGPAYRALRASDTGDNKAGYASRVDVGGRGWAYSGHECNSDSETLSERARREKPLVARLFPDKLHSYGTSSGGARARIFGYREQRSRHWLFSNGGIDTLGDLSRGLTYSVQFPDEEDGESLCNYRFLTYSVRKRVTRTVDGHYRIRVQTYGPGIDAYQGPQLDFEIDPDAVLPSDPSWAFKDALCGYCGLYYWQLPFLTNDPGVIFLSASVTEIEYEECEEPEPEPVEEVDSPCPPEVEALTERLADE